MNVHLIFHTGSQAPIYCYKHTFIGTLELTISVGIDGDIENQSAAVIEKIKGIWGCSGYSASDSD
jgi:hypothetical protein